MEVVESLDTHPDTGMAARGQVEFAAVIMGTAGDRTAPAGRLVDLTALRADF